MVTVAVVSWSGKVLKRYLSLQMTTKSLLYPKPIFICAYISWKYIYHCCFQTSDSDQPLQQDVLRFRATPFLHKIGESSLFLV